MLNRIEEKDIDRDQINRIHANEQDNDDIPANETTETEDRALFLLQRADSCQEKNIDKLRQAASTIEDKEAIISRAEEMIDSTVTDALLEVANNMFNGDGNN
uniref:Uncharacterized protein n=1 Tax=Orbilia brochopaga TaxID=3140254 RepID=A0A481ZN42_9PEZI|nr:hypothetical protein [Drechslerella brochopaga]QBL02526.1 hypothetical protein [Drechslerella brochopaga]